MGNSVVISWTPPDDDGGALVYGYVIEYRELPTDKWIKYGSTFTEQQISLTGLDANTKYRARVSALNIRGKGPESVSDEFKTIVLQGMCKWKIQFSW